MHMGHYISHVTEMIQLGDRSLQGFFSKKNGRVFLQTGVALWLESIPMHIRGPCCAHDFIGGDGTAIGIPVKQTESLSQVWEPPLRSREPVVDWGRHDRCPIRSSSKAKKDVKNTADARAFVRKLTDVSSVHSISFRDDLLKFRQWIPSYIVTEIERWLCLERSNLQWEPLRRLLRCISSNDSITGIITEPMIQVIHDMGLCFSRNDQQGLSSIIASNHGLLCQQGMGPEILQILDHQIQMNSIQSSTVNLLVQLGT